VAAGVAAKPNAAKEAPTQQSKSAITGRDLPRLDWTRSQRCLTMRVRIVV
jgi:hypothetical protein